MKTLKDLNDSEKLAVIQCGYQIIMSANGNIISSADDDCINVILNSVCDNELHQNALWNDAIWTDPYNSFTMLRGLLKDKELRCSFLRMITDLVDAKNNRGRFNCAMQVLDFVGYTREEVIAWSKSLRPIIFPTYL